MIKQGFGVWSRQWIVGFHDKTEAMAAPDNVANGISIFDNCHGRYNFLKVSTNAATDRTCTVKVWGYNEGTTYDNGTALTSHDGWTDTEEFISINSNANASVIQAFESLSCFTRVYAQLNAVTGTAQVHADFGFTGESDN